MAIPETQLDTWAHQGSISQSSDTYNAIKKKLEASSTPFADKSFSVFLQGSYGNDTNIYAESDVDIVIQLASSFQRDLEQLTESDKAAYNAAFSNATYSYADFKRDVLKVLTDAYGDEVKAGSKAILVPAGGGRRKADVIVAMEYRKYQRFKSTYDQSYVEGIVFYTSSGRQIINYPKQHSANLTTKHQGTGQWYKPMVRIIKNMRKKLAADGKISSADAPSYYLEGLLYNVPNGKFGQSYGDCFCNAVNWISGEDTSKFLCANEQYYLLRYGHDVCWSPDGFNKFFPALLELWKNW